MLIKGEKTYLELMEPGDAPAVRDWMNEIELRRLAWTECPLPVDLDRARQWIAEMNGNPRTHLLSIRRLAEGDLIGLMSLRNISWVSRSMRFGNLLWPSSLWNQGLGTDARRAFLDYAFKQLGMRRVYGFFASYNIASRRSHEKLGGEVRVTAREAVFIDGSFHDAHYYVYRRERFPGGADGPKHFYGTERPRPTPPDSAIARAYLDYYGCPPMETPELKAWCTGKPLCTAGSGQAVFVMDEISACGEVLFFPQNPSALPPDLIRSVIRLGFDDLNLHRLQACIPSAAGAWRQGLLDAGFADEGSLDGIVYAGGSYHDMVFLGAIKEDCNGQGDHHGGSDRRGDQQGKNAPCPSDQRGNSR